MASLHESVERFLLSCRVEKNLSADTLRAYSSDLYQYMNFGNTALDKPSLCTYIEHLHKNYQPKSVKRKIATLKVFCNYLVDEEILEQTPFQRIRCAYKEPKVLPKVVPFYEVERLLATAHAAYKANTSKENLKNVVVLEMLFAIGLRVSELCNLTPRHIDLDTGTVHIMGKGAKERVLQIANTAVISILRKYAEHFACTIKGSGYFFTNRNGQRLSEQSVRIILKNYTKLANIPLHITPHMIRHSFATLLLDEGVDIRYIQHFLGHSSISTTQIYTSVSTAKQKEILATKHPRNLMSI